MEEREDGEQVTIATYEGEPLAHLAAQRLQEEGIPCVVQPLGVGPGGWGLAANLPYALSVRAADQARAREILELAPGPSEEPAPRRRPSRLALMMLLLLGAVLILAADRLFELLFR